MYMCIHKISGETNFIFKMQNKVCKVRYAFGNDVERGGRVLI